MFNYEKTTYEVTSRDDENFYWTMMQNGANLYSPFKVVNDEFPHKDELGGVILKHIGAGASYFKVQREMPSPEEVNLVKNVHNFLEKKYNGLTTVKIFCEPHIEIRDINLDGKEDITYISNRKSNGEQPLKYLIKKLENEEDFTPLDHMIRYFIPFMGRKNGKLFRRNYKKFVYLFHESGMELPSIAELQKTECLTNSIMNNTGFSFLSR